MMSWKVVIVALVYWNVHMCGSQRRSRALYPSAFRVKRGTASMVNPIFQNSLEDINLLFEILIAGAKMEDERSPLTVLDEELASLRRTQKLEAICEDVVPRKLTDIRRLTSDLLQYPTVLRKDDFERTVLTMVYTAHRMGNTDGHQRAAWTESFINLYKAIKQDLITP
ncbi:protein FAM180A-like [Brienomyrus brachyistius]|uniref:protein FAM180A-like n=1 Tax=Brienomyrus brachyistius TaxID=42636 RepID=UPI0020B2B940|nr:protein FAM180A-like [Brienomyrus brachyistius]